MSDFITVDLISKPSVNPILMATHAARTCYSASVPKMGKVFDVKNRLFITGHHTTLEHSFFTFNIDGIPVSNMVFGLHLTAPFYNTDQRSGRFSKMYENPNMTEIRDMLQTYYPKVSQYNINDVCNYIEMGLGIYAENKERATKLASDALWRRSPKGNKKYIEDYIEKNASKLAQEQLRMFIPMIAPTALDFTVNIPTIAAFYRRATWTPFLRDTLDKMVVSVVDYIKQIEKGSYTAEELAQFDTEYMFETNKRNDKDWCIKMPRDYQGIKMKPEFELLHYKYDNKKFVGDDAPDMVDTMYYRPEAMNNSTMYVDTKIHVDAGATMGQDQRHRTIKRSEPVFTGYFYLPPLFYDLGSDANKFMDTYYKLVRSPLIPRSMIMSIAPYGAMVQYEKHADLNALVHEQRKRTCWCAQEAIYHISCDLRRDLAQCIGENAKLMNYLTPPCFLTGKCAEGARYCGRSIADDMRDGYFRNREI